MEALRRPDFWFRYHAVDEDIRLDAEQRFQLPWDERFEFKLDAGPDDLTLSLVERASGQGHVLGWWDDARWHLFALRWSELLVLVRTWRRRSDVPASPFPLLLLGRFVGFGVDENTKREEATRLVEEAYRSLGFNGSDVAQLTVHSLPIADEDDYRWTHDAELVELLGMQPEQIVDWIREHLPAIEARFAS